MLKQIAQLAKGQGSTVQAALRELEAEAERLQEAGMPMKPDNPVLLKTISTIEDEMVATQNLISANASEIEESGQEIAPVTVAAKLFMAVTIALITRGKNPVANETKYREAVRATGGQFVWPDDIPFATDYTQSVAWIARMEGWGKGYADIIGNALRQGLSQGWSPIRTAREARKLAENLPVSAAENITRTLQLISYREAGLQMEVLNGRYIERKIRIARLDERTCASCIALHGTELKLGERVDDHYRGRCDSILIPIGGSLPQTMQADSTPGNRRFVKWQTGEEWFASLPPERQAQQASFVKSPAKLRAYKDGVKLSEFVGDYEDDVFGHQIIEKSLVRTVDKPIKYYVGSDAK
jgi:hypothetical protein